MREYTGANSLIENAPDEKAFRDYVNWLVLESKWSGDIDWEFLGFIDNYIMLAKIIPQNYIVVDVGCCYGLQHVLFKNHVAYIGFEHSEDIPIRTFTANAKIIRGKFADEYDELNKYRFAIEEHKMFGIASMSLLYGKANNVEDIRLFNEIFERKFII